MSAWFASVMIVAALFWIGRRLFRLPHPVPELRRKKLIYRDRWGAKLFRAEGERIVARPDFLYQFDDSSVAVVEYKSRFGPVYPSDCSQLVATTIAVRGHYPNARVGFVYTRSRKYVRLDLRGSTAELVRSIDGELRAARDVKRHLRPPAKPSLFKCRACGVRAHCPDAAA